MTIFKSYLKILNRNKFIVILYTVILVVFAGVNVSTNEKSIGFVASKPDVLIIDNDNSTISKNIIDYFDKKSNLIKIDNDEDKINDALFYREINYAIYIPENFQNDFMNHNNPRIDVKGTGDYNASYANMLLNEYLVTANSYLLKYDDVDDITNKINETLFTDIKVEMKTKLDTDSMERASFYFSFESYSILACLIYVICLVLSIFNSEKIRKKNIISGTNYKKINRDLLMSNFVYSFIVWLFYFVLALILIGDVLMSLHGILFAINSFVFTLVATSIAFLIGSFVTKKEAISGIVNVIALGSSFLCGAFVPVSYLPDFVLKIAHILPTYWYIQNNEEIANLETVSLSNLNTFITNLIVLFIFCIIYIILTNIITKRKQKIG